MAYSGETNRKRLARSRIWLEVLRSHSGGAAVFNKGKHFILPSVECGDLAFLTAINVPARNSATRYSKHKLANSLLVPQRLPDMAQV